AQFRFVRLSDAFTTGSSIMPQKRNPDAAELVRGKTGRIFGSLQALLVMLKGLPLTYSKDMQEDKEPVFDAADSLALVVPAMTGMIGDLRVDRKAMATAAGSGFATATDLADWLVQNADLPFREAHHVVGRVVAAAEVQGKTLEAMTLAELQAVDARIEAGALAVLGPRNSVLSRKSFGGTAPARVRDALRKWRKKLL
ncbi:MAG: argininosuccinate lyase, partial [Alphaproteobacteria bacterium]|nr:argininosuccinate lyase [Alphaproteobacteria bacterium]